MNSDDRIAVTSRSFSRHPILCDELLNRYGNVTFNDKGLKLTGQALIDYLQGHDKAITALEIIDDCVLDRLPDLKVISKYGVGIDMVDMAALTRHGVSFGWTGGVNRRSVSEMVISMAIALLRHIPRASTEVREGTWRQHVGSQLTKKTVGIVGCGHIGKDLTQLLTVFDCTIFAHDILDFPEFYARYDVKPVTLPELLSDSDIVTLHLPLDDTTRMIVSGEQLRMMKPSAILLNLARGGLVDEAALKESLITGGLFAAGFDVFAEEPPQDAELISLPNFLTTPHIGGSAEEAILAMGMAAIEGLDNHAVPL